MDVSYSVQLVVVVSVIAHSNSSIQEGFGQQFFSLYVVCLVRSLNRQGRHFTFPGMLPLGTGRSLASSLVLLQMPAIWADPRVELSPLFLFARD